MGVTNTCRDHVRRNRGNKEEKLKRELKSHWENSMERFRVDVGEDLLWILGGFFINIIALMLNIEERRKPKGTLYTHGICN